MVARLKNLKWKFHVHDARHSRQVALREWIGRGALFKVLALLRRGPGLIWNGVALDHAAARRHFVPSGVIFQGVRRTTGSLPDALQVRLPVWSARDSSRVGCGPDTGPCGLREREICGERSDREEGKQNQNFRDHSVGHRSTTTCFSVWKSIAS